MKKTLYTIIGISFSLATMLGILLSLWGIITVWRYVPVVSGHLMESALFAQRALDSSDELLDVAETTLTQTEENVTLIADATNAMAASLDETASMASSISKMMEDQFIGAVENTQTALTSLESSAKLVDDTLSVIAALPFLGTKYSNQTPLYTSVVEINQSLSDIPENMRNMQENLDATASAIIVLNENVKSLSGNVTEIESNVSEAKAIVTTYQGLVNEVQVEIARIIDKLPHWVNWAAIATTVIFVWLILIQAGLLLVSWDLAGWRRESQHTPDTQTPEKRISAN
jgi:hypothetical protein